MQTAKFSGIIVFCVCLLLATGCNSELQDLKIQNDTQRQRISSLESELQVANLQLDQLKRQLSAMQSKGGVEMETLQQKIKALEDDIAKKEELIATMQQKLLTGGAALPVELSTMLEDFAKQHGMVTYDPATGIVKFDSDLLFEKGSDTVKPDAVESVKMLCRILDTEEGKNFDVIIAGHTDDMRIATAATREKHPTNWALSSHRAISVLHIMEDCKINPKRLSTRGFGEYRPIAPNKPNKGGNPQNRRVEIYIVPQGT